ncbi:uncharacterized protein LOC117072728 isoform X2 [Trachypithecus francoisi]|uniref:uncharacterized protein LOC117072728 isoform X2 n=1 Tax=Trachypithecus francoisi TaxID=54180 RepID=UPI00141A80C8|nr:uncharacterized protein LOC117072728 isoform X2 [Trachypithecus francoisi]
MVSPREADMGRGKDTRLDLPLDPARAPLVHNSLGEVERRGPREQTRDGRPAPASREPWGRGCRAPGGSTSHSLCTFPRAAENEHIAASQVSFHNARLELEGVQQTDSFCLSTSGFVTQQRKIRVQIASASNVNRSS